MNIEAKVNTLDDVYMQHQYSQVVMWMSSKDDARIGKELN